MTVDFVHVAAFIILFGFFWRLMSMKFAGTKVGAAMAFVY